MQYLHFAGAFGARRTDPALLDENGRVDFEKVRQSSAFQTGVERLRTGVAKGYRIALMCAEAEPLDCHRFGMVSGYLADQGFSVQHILKDKTLITNAELETRLLKKYAKALNPLSSTTEQRAQAYRLLNRAIGFTPET